MLRIFPEQLHIIDDRVVFSESYHHIKNVIRLKTDDRMELIYNGNLFLIEIESFIIKKKEISGRIIKKSIVPDICSGVKIAITPVKHRFDEAIENMCQLPIDKIIPFYSDHSIIRYDNKKEKKLLDRWRNISKSSAMQSRAGKIVDIDSISSFDNIVLMKGVYKIAFSIVKDCRNIRELSNEIMNRDVLAIIGPEGDFSSNEKNIFENMGIPVVRLSGNILRTGNAGVIISTILLYMKGKI